LSRRAASARVAGVEGAGLIGRDAECARLDALVATVAGGGSAVLLVSGDPGLGKTALLGHAGGAAASVGVRVVRLAGVESECELPFAGVHRLLLDLDVPANALPDVQRAALDVAFGRTAGPPPDRFRIGVAVSTSLAAAEGPLLCVVDDLQWIDPDSRDVLAFVARRLHEGGVGLLLGERTAATPGPFADLPDLRLDGLDPVAATALLGRVVGRPLDPPIARRIVTATAGNPLAILELSAELSGHQLVGGTLLPEPLPIGHTLERHYLAQVRELPAETQTWLLIAATADSGDPGVVAGAAAILGVAADAAAPAEVRQLVRAAHRVEFRHPLVAAAVYNGATSAQRGRVHRAVAHALGAGTFEQTWHLAAASVGRDEAVAAALEDAASRAAERGGHAARATFLQRAAELSPEGPGRLDRLLSAAEALTASGFPARAGELMGSVPLDGLEGVRRGRAMLVLVDIHLASGDVGRVSRLPVLCMAAADAFAAEDPAGEVTAMLRALESALTLEHGMAGTTMSELAERALQCTAARSGSLAGALLVAMAELATRPYADAASALRAAADALAAAPEEAATLRHVIVGYAITTALFDEQARDDLVRRAAEASRHAGALQTLHSVLWLRSLAEAGLGRPASAARLLQEVREVGRTIGLTAVTEVIFSNAMGSAWRGGEPVREEIGRTAAIGRASGMTGMETIAAHAGVVLDLAEGRFQDAFPAAAGIRAARFLQVGNAVLADLVEAAVFAGRDAEAAAAAADLDEIARASGMPWSGGLAARCRALCATDGVAVEAHFRESAGLLARTRATGELARTRLLYGEWLRRSRRRRAARVELRAAVRGFEEAGAASFADRARRELRATGESPATGALTAQEFSVAELAAGGATNAEIAVRLSLSPHTVDYHLRKVFRKLDIGHRRELAGALKLLP
jgi:DNA-binding CsgD family transcriptional regulator